MMRIRNRVALIALPLTLGVLAVGAASASANSSQWGDNGSGTCPSGAELGTYCMMSVTGWIQINGGATQNQAISCSNNAPGGSPGLSWSLDGQAYTNAGPWYSVFAGYQGPNTGDAQSIGWQTGDGGDAGLSPENWIGGVTAGNNNSDAYGSGGASVSNFGGGGHWQAAIACFNAAAPGSAASTQAASAAPVQIRDRTFATVNKVKGTAFLAREYALKKNVTRTGSLTCPAGMVRKGKLEHTVQEFPAYNKAPKWKDRSLVEVKMTAKGKNAGSVKMTLKRAKNPTVVQFQLRCGKR